MPAGPAIAEMFGEIAGRYDLANHVLSLGLDFGWRRALVRAVAATPPRVVVDLCTGSGDVAFALKRRLGAGTDVRGLDFCRPMLEAAERKKAARPWARDLAFAFGDCLDLPLAAGAADALTIAFGLRNLADRPRAYREMRRVLRPGGALFVLEFSQVEGWFRPVYGLYRRRLLPAAARVLTGHAGAYHYLADSIGQFPGRAALARELAEAGFAPVRHAGLAGGAVALHIATAPAPVPASFSDANPH
jgi:demethylmenaquinone methyltransferase / 2-methoxy-6-polyprenyl-1,4-benzoquinol methylase